ncbi:MAG: type I-C CRISPR-associated endonuclease Cas1c [Armatimonadota bacterium]
MTRELLNTLFVSTPGAYVRVDHETLCVELEGKKVFQVPVHHLGGLVLFGGVGISGEALRRCAKEGRQVTLLDHGGRFQARVVGPTSRNVLLRKAQYEAHCCSRRTLEIARMIAAGKLRNSRGVLVRAAREAHRPGAADRLREAAAQCALLLEGMEEASSLDQLRGHEGQVAALYFGAFGEMLGVPTEEFAFRHRTRRPPRDRVNALLSFLYTLLTADCVAAIEGVGLDPQFGYLHALRPGRPALALDLVEEFRAPVADRLVLTLINRRQVRPEHFEERPGGSATLTAEGRKLVLAAYQRRKQDEVPHPLFGQPVPLGLAPHLQARLLARHLRGELLHYPPYVHR